MEVHLQDGQGVVPSHKLGDLLQQRVLLGFLLVGKSGVGQVNVLLELLDKLDPADPVPVYHLNGV